MNKPFDTASTDWRGQSRLVSNLQHQTTTRYFNKMQQYQRINLGYFSA